MEICVRFYFGISLRSPYLYVFYEAMKIGCGSTMLK